MGLCSSGTNSRIDRWDVICLVNAMWGGEGEVECTYNWPDWRFDNFCEDISGRESELSQVTIIHPSERGETKEVSSSLHALIEISSVLSNKPGYVLLIRYPSQSESIPGWFPCRRVATGIGALHQNNVVICEIRLGNLKYFYVMLVNYPGGIY